MSEGWTREEARRNERVCDTKGCRGRAVLPKKDGDPQLCQKCAHTAKPDEPSAILRERAAEVEGIDHPNAKIAAEMLRIMADEVDEPSAFAQWLARMPECKAVQALPTSYAGTRVRFDVRQIDDETAAQIIADMIALRTWLAERPA